MGLTKQNVMPDDLLGDAIGLPSEIEHQPSRSAVNIGGQLTDIGELSRNPVAPAEFHAAASGNPAPATVKSAQPAYQPGSVTQPAVPPAAFWQGHNGAGGKR